MSNLQNNLRRRAAMLERQIAQQNQKPEKQPPPIINLAPVLGGASTKTQTIDTEVFPFGGNIFIGAQAGVAIAQKKLQMEDLKWTWVQSSSEWRTGISIGSPENDWAVIFTFEPTMQLKDTIHDCFALIPRMYVHRDYAWFTPEPMTREIVQGGVSYVLVSMPDTPEFRTVGFSQNDVFQAAGNYLLKRFYDMVMVLLIKHKVESPCALDMNTDEIVDLSAKYDIAQENAQSGPTMESTNAHVKKQES